MTLLPRFLLRRAERTLNALLQRDPATPGRLSPLIGRTIELRLTPPAYSIALTATTAGLRFTAPPAHSADASVTFSPAAVGALIAGTPSETLIMQGSLRIEGDINMLHDVRCLLGQLDPDVEGALAQLIGPLPAHALIHQLRRQQSLGRDIWTHMRTGSADYITEEARVLVGNRQRHVICDQLDDLSRQLAHDERRLAYLEQRFSAPAHDNNKKEPYA